MMMVPAKSFLIAGALATSGVMAGILTIPRDALIVVEAPQISMTDTKADFADDWRRSSAALALQTAMVERSLPIEPQASPEPPAPTNVPLTKTAEADKETKTVKRERHVEAGKDICARNHLRTKFIRNGKSWRCVK